MSETWYSRRVWLPVSLVVVCLLLGASISVWLGQDANWDLRDYHLYNGYSALHGRFQIDLAAASLQSWINPTLDIPYAWLALGPWSQQPRLLAAFMGLWYGALVAVILAIAIVLYRRWPAETRWPATITATIIASTGAAVFSQVGTTFNEIQISTLVLGSVLLLAREVDAESSALPRSGVVLMAGVLLGAAAGLKFTSGIYAPAACLALLASVRANRWLACCALLVTGGIAGFALGGGWWAYKLYELFGNPVFPFFNSIFRSPWYPPVDFFDRRFLPHDIWQELFYPLYWLANKRMLATEIPFRDGRVAVFFVLGLAAAAVLAFDLARRWVAGKLETKPAISPTPAQKYLIVFAIVSYLLWLSTTSILRYGIPMEASTCLAIPLLLSFLVRPDSSRARSHAWIALATIIPLALLVTTRYAAWGRMPYRPRVASADMKWLQPSSLVVFVGAPISYVAPFALPRRRAAFVGLTDVVFESRGYRLANEVIGRIRAHRGPIALVWETPDQWRLPSISDAGLVRIPGSCRLFYGSYESEKGRGLHTCEAKLAILNPLKNSFWRQAAQRYNEIEVPEPVPGWSYAAFVDAVGGAAMGKKYVDDFEYLWSREPDRPKKFDDKILPHTLYILSPSLKARALRAMKRNSDLVATIDGVLVLAPGWKQPDSGIPTPSTKHLR